MIELPDPAKSDVINKPFLTSYDLNVSSWTKGARHKLQLGVENHVSELKSDTVSFLLADVPSTPVKPTRISDGKSIKIIMAAPSSNGGSQITSY
jgi:hypothetical protein